MIWDITLWIAAAVLVLAVVLRLRGGKKPKTSSNFLTSGKALPVIAAAVVVLALIMRLELATFSSAPDWNEEQLVEIESFREALAQYDLATMAFKQGKLNREDWESIKALLEASGSEMDIVSNDVLSGIHSELPAHVANEFLPGIRMGTYGLFKYLEPKPKGVKSPDLSVTPANDSLEEGRRLLGDWNRWFDGSQEEILSRIE
jgi:hypothetical protein